MRKVLQRAGARPVATLLATVLALTLAGCSDDSGSGAAGTPAGEGSGGTPSAGGTSAAPSGGEPSDDPESSASSESSESSASSASAEETTPPYLPVPDGVELTPQGSELAVGDPAVVAYRPRQGVVGALRIKVTKLQRTTFEQSFVGWQLDPTEQASTPYFVRASITNVGDTDLGGRPVPLYVVDGDNVLLEATTFESTFAPCPSRPFPERFRAGDRTRVCLVYLAPDRGDLAGVSFRPSQAFNPIVWTGDVEPLRPRKKG